MPHFLAFYRCCKCKEPIGALVSNTLLIVRKADKSGEGPYELINPQEIELMSDLRLYCSRCTSAGLLRLKLKCRGCGTESFLFYTPGEVYLNLLGEKKEQLIVFTNSLLAEAGKMAYCFDCGEAWEKERDREPMFLFSKVE